MRYEAPREQTEAQILQILDAKGTGAGERINAVLSAIYFGESIEFSADVLIKEFGQAKYAERRSLKNLFSTFYGMCRVDYRIDESIGLLREYELSEPSCALETREIIDELQEYKEMLAKDAEA